jgi:hypothetical protein
VEDRMIALPTAARRRIEALEVSAEDARAEQRPEP